MIREVIKKHLIIAVIAACIGVIAVTLLVREAKAPAVFRFGSPTPTNQPIAPYFSPLTLETIFDAQPVIVHNDSETVTLLVTGDVLSARSVNAKTTRFNDFTWPWQRTADILRQADLTYINLETPLTADCPVTEVGMIFCGDLRNTDGLTFTGVDVVNVANNHMGNQDLDGVTQTTKILTDKGFTISGTSNTETIREKGTTFAFLGYNEVDNQVGIARAEDELIRQQVAAAKQTAEVVVVQFHWGQEYRRQPTANQIRLGRLAIDAGANLVVGNHPHWWQAMEIYKGVPIVYSHGNFIFDQMWSHETREGVVGKYTFYQGQLVDLEFLPLLIEDYGQPRWLEGEEKIKVLRNMKEESQVLDSRD